MKIVNSKDLMYNGNKMKMLYYTGTQSKVRKVRSLSLQEPKETNFIVADNIQFSCYPLWYKYSSSYNFELKIHQVLMVS